MVVWWVVRHSTNRLTAAIFSQPGDSRLSVILNGATGGPFARLEQLEVRPGGRCTPHVQPCGDLAYAAGLEVVCEIRKFVHTKE